MVQWLFSVTPSLHQGFSVREEMETEQGRIQFASAFILEQIGIVAETTEETHLDVMLTKFGGAFPTTREFSAFARSTLADVSAQDDPDLALMAWMEREEILFRTLEKHLIADRLSQGFVEDVGGFLQILALCSEPPQEPGRPCTRKPPRNRLYSKQDPV
jgi:hypothetical protein